MARSGELVLARDRQGARLRSHQDLAATIQERRQLDDVPLCIKRAREQEAEAWMQRPRRDHLPEYEHEQGPRPSADFARQRAALQHQDAALGCQDADLGHRNAALQHN